MLRLAAQRALSTPSLHHSGCTALPTAPSSQLTCRTRLCAPGAASFTFPWLRTQRLWPGQRRDATRLDATRGTGPGVAHASGKRASLKRRLVSDMGMNHPGVTVWPDTQMRRHGCLAISARTETRRHRVSTHFVAPGSRQASLLTPETHRMCCVNFVMRSVKLTCQLTQALCLSKLKYMQHDSCVASAEASFDASQPKIAFGVSEA